ncbi:alpha/beta fold hydrolase [Rhizobium sp. YJ-22]|uniref:alpha/beta fold hydrolase n=1 Tax=Rhizobium sp. YJ-22 TaxID=3037556 RepID=UPI0024121F95|nr:alpha/beta fold hydrolase [Rhizobium sp. YJ-22]MDG3579718.1 alpha/beta fold hydrolase [Rhizobium sp. YJ-22]
MKFLKDTTADSKGMPLVLLPGTACDERLFLPLVERLDHEGPILTGGMRGARSMPAMAQKLLAEAPERFLLLGFSLGGIAALEIAAQAPERLAGLILIDTTPRPDPQANAAPRRAALAKARDEGMAGYILDAWPRLVASGNMQDEDLRRLLVDMAVAAGAEALDEQTEMAIHRADSRARLKDVACPALVLAGAEEQVCPIEAHREIADGIAGAEFHAIDGAGHFSPLEKPDAVAFHIRQWLASGSASASQSGRSRQGADMSENDVKSTKPAALKTREPVEQVLQVERRDYMDLAPVDRPRSQSLEGFDDIYTDIVDYIVRCTHRIWDERDIGLIYSHYTHNCVLYGTLGTIYNREDVVRDTIQRLVSLPERRGMATQVLWCGNDQEGFYTSHLVTGSGRHTQYGHFGQPTGRTFVSRTIADCMIHRNKIYREWVVADTMAIIKQLGLDPNAFAERFAKAAFDKGLLSLDIGENRRLLGQYPPEAVADTSIAHNELEAETLQWLHEVFNQRMFGKIKDVYAPNCQYHGPLMKELYGIAAVTHQHLGLIGSIPDAAYMPQHICSTPCEEGGVKVAVRWLMEGHHLGYGILQELGDPTGARLQVMGMTHYHYKDGKIVDEWNVYDELSLLTQVKLAKLAADAQHPA